MNPNTDFEPRLLLDKLDQDEELARELVQAFVEDAPLRMERLEEAVASGDGVSASEAAHSLKGMCGVLRVQALVDLALSMEVAGRKGDLEKVASELKMFKPNLLSVFDQARVYLGQ